MNPYNVGGTHLFPDWFNNLSNGISSKIYNECVLFPVWYGEIFKSTIDREYLMRVIGDQIPYYRHLAVKAWLLLDDETRRDPNLTVQAIDGKIVFTVVRSKAA